MSGEEPPATVVVVSGRVDKLLKLIENASTAAGVRMMAAKQVATHVEIVMKHGEELYLNQANVIINRMLLTSKVWDVRMAADMCLSESIKHVMQEESKVPSLDIADEESKGRKLIHEFDIEAFIETHDRLVASSGAEFDVDLTAMSINQQKQQLKKTLELMEGLGDLGNDLIEDKDLEVSESSEQDSNRELSSREKAMLRRKSRLESIKKDSSERNKGTAIRLELVESDAFIAMSKNNALIRAILTLRSNVLNSTWTVRHGALLGLKSLINRHYNGANLLTSILARDALAALCLDRFSDFNTDQTVAPVRETAAQLLTVLFQQTSDLPLKGLIWEKAIQLARYDIDWQVRQGGLLCIRYFSALDSQLFTKSQDEILNLCIEGCSDADEDIRSISTELISRIITPSHPLVGQINNKVLRLLHIGPTADDSLDEVDNEEDASELASTTLVNSFCILQKIGDLALNDPQLIVLLLARMRHPICSVREKVLELLNVVRPSQEDTRILVLRLLIQNILLDDSPTIRETSRNLALSMIKNLPPELYQKFLPSFVALSTSTLCSLGRPFESKHFVFVKGLGEDSRPQCDSLPAGHEIGFKSSDMMVLPESAILEARRIASSVLECCCNTFYPDPNMQQKMARALTRKDDSLSRCCSLWIFGSNSFSSSSSSPPPSPPQLADEDCSIWQLREWAAYMYSNAGDLTINQSTLIRYLETETEVCLRADTAALLARTCIQDCLDVIKFKAFRPNALPVFVLACNDIINTGPSSPSISTTMAAELVNVEIIKDGLTTHFEQSLRALILTSLELEETEEVWKEDLVAELIERMTRKEPNLMTGFLVKEILPRLYDRPLERRKILLLVQRIFEDETLLAEMCSLFLVPVLARIADQDESVRGMAARLFGTLVQLVPLRTRAVKIDPAHDVEGVMRQRLTEADEFLSQFIGDSLDDLRQGGQKRTMTIPDYELPVKINAELRPYQRAGVNWLLFLARYGLNGALCDDMGLGKTLQTITLLACIHHQWKREEKDGEARHSLIVCPASLLGHWQHEVQQYAPSLGDPLVFSGSANDRRRLWRQAQKTMPQVMITSYETVRSDMSSLSSIHWCYVVLDEGHVIKNPKTKLSQAVKCLRADHRLILSGTPIQNNVLELWSLFDFLLPGMLGSNEGEFMERYGRPIMAVQPGAGPSNTRRVSTSAAAAAAATSNARTNVAQQRDFAEAERKLAALHKQVLPFLLRRMKEDVLKDLPPKIVQDLECDPSPIQRMLADAIADIGISQMEGQGKEVKANALQVLQYLRKICVHPKLVLSEDHPLMEQVMTELKRCDGTLDDLSMAPKLLLLKELLEECGLGEPEMGDATDGELVDADRMESRHRVLIFAQQKSTLDLIETDVLRTHLPHLNFLRLDGSVEQRRRFSIAQRFNNDLEIDALLLTTPVGGLGLNLTGADTVIFVEHDWNPMRDLQAMDRAHRLGQRRTVNVYRLIVRDTLEQQIMGLQRWKTRVAATIVQQQDSMQGDAKTAPQNLLDLLRSDEEPSSSSESKRARTNGESGGAEAARMRKWMAKHGAELATDLAEDETIVDQYEKAFNVDSFIGSISNNQ